MSKHSDRNIVVRQGKEFPKLTKDELRRKALAALAAMTDEEDAAITAAALSDPDNPPVDLLSRRRGRPPKENAKIAVSLRLDADVVDSFRATGPGWQSRVNEALRRDRKLD
jgi:uncharacterized protein (DUF4415 family)